MIVLTKREYILDNFAIGCILGISCAVAKNYLTAVIREAHSLCAYAKENHIQSDGVLSYCIQIVGSDAGKVIDIGKKTDEVRKNG